MVIGHAKFLLPLKLFLFLLLFLMVNLFEACVYVFFQFKILSIFLFQSPLTFAPVELLCGIVIPNLCLISKSLCHSREKTNFKTVPKKATNVC